ncbi:MAG: hypothetical protein K2X93_09425 [Candidatus Obscuribacterales bacterium]|nr:hypothetical protein [Candidatus Obscuribacterales bacterium]
MNKMRQEVKILLPLPRLRKLNFSERAVTDSGIKTISQIRTHQDLAIRRTKVSITGLKALSPLHLTGFSIARDHLFNNYCMVVVARQWKTKIHKSFRRGHRQN